MLVMVVSSVILGTTMHPEPQMLKAKRSVRNDLIDTLNFPDLVHKIFIKFNSILVIVLSREGTKLSTQNIHI